MLRRFSKAAKAPLISLPLSVMTCSGAPYLQYICSQKKMRNSSAVLFFKAFASQVPDRSSLAATIQVHLSIEVGMCIISTNIFENNLTGIEIVSGISTFFKLRT